MAYLALSLALTLFARGATSQAQGQPTWNHPPLTPSNNLTQALYGEGTNGFIYNSSNPQAAYGGYNYCNMPHVRRAEYVVPKIPGRPREKGRKGRGKLKLEFVEIIQRHHKRTPYESNLFPKDGEGEGGKNGWDCSGGGSGGGYMEAVGRVGRRRDIDIDTELGYVGGLGLQGRLYEDPLNLLSKKSGGESNCQFPQITEGGLEDSWWHGKDLYSVYHKKLRFIPRNYDPALVRFRVTSNQITTQVAGALIQGMYGDSPGEVPLFQQPSSVDTLRPGYSCPSADFLRSSYITSPPHNPTWALHLTLSSPLFQKLDTISSVPTDSQEWHSWWDHYFDNLSSMMCHGLPLPCVNGTCISEEDVHTVFRLGQWEYDYIYRSVGQESLEYSRNKFGLWVYEVAERIGAIVRGDTGAVGVKYIHNIAHDGSMSYLLSALQVRQMVWPGLGAEVVFEVWSASSGRRMHGGGDDNDGDDDDDDASVVDTGIGVGEEQEQESSESPETLQESRKKDYYIRILWNGQPLHSNAAELGKVDMLPAEQVLGYLRSLVGTERESGGDVVERCKL